MKGGAALKNKIFILAALAALIAVLFCGCSEGEKIEEELNRLFPSARILRMDTDTTSKKGGHQQIPDRNENALDTVPHLLPVTCEQPHENIQYTENDTRYG